MSETERDDNQPDGRGKNGTINERERSEEFSFESLSCSAEI